MHSRIWLELNEVYSAAVLWLHMLDGEPDCMYTGAAVLSSWHAVKWGIHACLMAWLRVPAGLLFLRRFLTLRARLLYFREALTRYKALFPPGAMDAFVEAEVARARARGVNLSHLKQRVGHACKP